MATLIRRVLWPIKGELPFPGILDLFVGFFLALLVPFARTFGLVIVFWNELFCFPSNITRDLDMSHSIQMVVYNNRGFWWLIALISMSYLLRLIIFKLRSVPQKRFWIWVTIIYALTYLIMVPKPIYVEWERPYAFTY